jgi:hypothetical protein
LASTLTERRYKQGLGIAGGLVHGVAEAAHLGDGFCVRREGMFGPGCAQLVGGPAAGGFGLLEHPFERSGWHSRKRLSRRDIAWIWEALFHEAMMSIFW